MHFSPWIFWLPFRCLLAPWLSLRQGDSLEAEGKMVNNKVCSIVWPGKMEARGCGGWEASCPGAKIRLCDYWGRASGEDPKAEFPSTAQRTGISCHVEQWPWMMNVLRSHGLNIWACVDWLCSGLTPLQNVHSIQSNRHSLGSCSCQVTELYSVDAEVDKISPFPDETINTIHHDRY